MKPHVLLATTCRWFSAARLAVAMTDAGCEVDLVAPHAHPAQRTEVIRRRHAFSGLSPLTSIGTAIARARPDIVVPCDDLATSYLHALHAVLSERAPEHPVAALVRRSLGPAESFPILASRASLINFARGSGIRAPATARVTRDSLPAWLMEHGCPAVLKTDGSAGGRGVQFVSSIAEAEATFRRLKVPPSGPRAIKRALFDQDRNLIRPWILRRQNTVNAQVVVRGRDATTSVACWKGRILALIHVEAVKTQSDRGPSSVVRVIENAEMTKAAEILVHGLNLSGFIGLDFVLTEGTPNHAWLIEVNARATQICHLALGDRKNLPVALTAAVAGISTPHTRAATDRDLIALFPQEWQTDPSSPYLTTAYHDVPWTAPGLLKASIDFHHSRNAMQSTTRAILRWSNWLRPGKRKDDVRRA